MKVPHLMNILYRANRMEPRKQDQRLIPKNYYYIDYKEFVDVVKWKMYKMQTLVRDNLRTESENKGYVCNNCEKQFSPLDVLSLVDMSDQLFHCDMCEHVLEENDNAENVKGSQQILTKLREQSQPIITLLKQTDSLVIPSSYIYKHSAGSRASKSDEYELAIAQDTGAGQGDIIVDLQMDNEAARRAKMEEAEQKRQQNALPVWHQQSTISGTSLVGTGDRPAEEEQDEEDTFEDIGPTEMDADTEDYYAKYYESLSNNNKVEEDRDVFETVDTQQSLVETFEDQSINENSNSGEEFDEDEDIPLVSGNVIFQRYKVLLLITKNLYILVNGKMIPLNEVQEEDQRNMSTDEYKAYYEAWENWQNN